MSVITPNTETEQDVATEEAAASEPRLVAIIAEFEKSEPLLLAAEKIRDAGYTRWDTYSPFPLHGMDEAMGIRRTFLPWLVLAGGFAGVTLAVFMQWYMNASEWAEYLVGWPLAGYQFPISGKPYWSLPANIPIAFELTVLLSAFAAFFGMLILNRMLQWYNPLFKLERFKRATDDRFFASIEAADPKFDSTRLPEYFMELGATEVEEVWDDESRRIPAGFFKIGLVVFALSLVPPVLVMWHRSVPSAGPRLHPVMDMDFQAKFKSQQRNIFFADNRAMRPQVPGTVARGEEHVGDVRYHLGINPAGQAMASFQDEAAAEEAGGGGESGEGEGDGSQPAPKPEAAADDTDEDQASPPAEGETPAAEAGEAGGTAAEGQAPKDPPSGMNENQDWVETIPIAVDEALMAQGQKQFGIYCAPCHGYGGFGDGVINLRAMALPSTDQKWIPVPSLHAPQTRNRPDGYIFRAITEGVRKMPAYGKQIKVHDRWAIVAYVRALQRSQGAPAQ